MGKSKRLQKTALQRQTRNYILQERHAKVRRESDAFVSAITSSRT